MKSGAEQRISECKNYEGILIDLFPVIADWPTKPAYEWLEWKTRKIWNWVFLQSTRIFTPWEAQNGLLWQIWIKNIPLNSHLARQHKSQRRKMQIPSWKLSEYVEREIILFWEFQAFVTNFFQHSE